MPAASANLETTRIQICLALLITAALPAWWWLQPDPYVPLLAAVVVLAAISAVNRPFIVCLMFIVLSFFRIHEAYPVLNDLHLPLLIALVTIAAVVWHVVFARSVTPFWSTGLKWFVVFFLLTSLGVFLAFNPPMASTYWIDVFSKIGLMTLAFAWLARSANDFTLAGKMFVASGILIAIVAIYNKFNGIGLVELTRVTIGRDIKSLLGDPNDLALVLLFPLSFCVAFAIHQCGNFTRALGIGGTLIILTAIVFTQSRGGLIGVLAVVAVTLTRHSRSKLKLLALGIAAATFLYFAMGIEDRISGGGGDGLDESAADRLEAWLVAGRMAMSRPLTGVGLANFADSFSGFGSISSGHAIVAHSTWFSVLGETGFVGLAAFIGMVGYTLRDAIRSFRAVNAPGFRMSSPENTELVRAFAFALLAGLTSFCVAGSFLTQGFTWPIYILVGLSTALARFVGITTAARD